ncbi:ABC transporter permease [Seohaeicola zhoushanensis]|uniref:ABC transporter permease n=1 Tax=Seohaeicola zhoushanensis TaxID=1569283 RepID=A0A8J3GVC6_9RHOB|nr:ABC transporter permease [Seohaeicola zhoushanensis]GHF42721.1 ABC transporter permease [Seohaeicola zhoushanensis]
MNGPRLAASWTLLVFAFMYLPVAVVLLFSLNDSEIIAFPLQGLTLDWYREVVSDPRLARGFGITMMVAAPVAVLSTLLGALAALALTRYDMRFKAAFAALLLVPFLIPRLILAVGQLIVLSDLGIARSLVTVVLGQTVVILPFTSMIIASVLMRVDRRLEEAATDLGASAWSVFRRVTLPLMRNGLIAAMFIAFVLASSETVLTTFVSGRQQPLSLLVASDFRFAISPSLNALAVLIVFGNIALVLLGEAVRRRSLRK